MPLVPSTEFYSRPTKSWFVEHFIKGPLKLPIASKRSWLNLFKKALLVTYPPDGYDVVTGVFTYPNNGDIIADPNKDASNSAGKNLPVEMATLPLDSSEKDLADKNTDGELSSSKVVSPANREAVYEGADFGWLLLFAAFLGLPSRPRAYIDKNGKLAPILTWSQIGLNFLGGFDYAAETSEEKSTWQLALIGFKLFNPVLHTIVFIIKLPINIIKILTELIPILVTSTLTQYLFLATAQATDITAFAFRSFTRLAYKITFTPELSFLQKLASSLIGIIVTAITLIPPAFFSTLTFCFGIVHTSMKIIYLVGKATTSPLEAFRMAKAVGGELKIESLSALTGKSIAFLLSVLFALITFTLSVAAWSLLGSILLPFAVGGLATYFPAAFQSIAWIFNVPVIGTSMNVINGALLTAGASLSSIFGSTIAALSNIIGVQITVGHLLLGAMIGAIALPIASFLSRTAQVFGNFWASWCHKGPLDHAKRFFSKPQITSSPNGLEHDHDQQRKKSGSEIHPKIVWLRNELTNSQRSFEECLKSADALNLKIVGSKAQHKTLTEPRSVSAASLTSTGSIKPHTHSLPDLTKSTLRHEMQAIDEWEARLDLYSAQPDEHVLDDWPSSEDEEISSEYSWLSTVGYY